eukprot:GILJ01003534.1.p1 GENE.GILJ01003534.1~~GILJ01003534.1.p1  ORF type:complete len:134 (-),score=10.39 GILJ01003534.1:97-498(-)
MTVTAEYDENNRGIYRTLGAIAGLALMALSVGTFMNFFGVDVRAYILAVYYFAFGFFLFLSEIGVPYFRRSALLGTKFGKAAYLIFIGVLCLEKSAWQAITGAYCLFVALVYMIASCREGRTSSNSAAPHIRV